MAITESISERESISRYAELCQQAVETAYPGATVEVEYEVNVGGAAPAPRAYDPEGVPCDNIADHVERICDTVYEAMEWIVA